MSTTFANTINGNPIYADRAEKDQNGDNIEQTYAKKSALATVATSGDYDDLTNKPSIPAAQVNADWNASSGVAEILNKPSLAAVATSGAYSDLSGTPTINNVPAVTSNDDAKVLKASYTGGVGSYSWEQGSNNGKVYGMDGTESFNDIYEKIYTEGMSVTWLLNRVSPYAGKATYVACELNVNDSSHTSGYIKLSCMMSPDGNSKQMTMFFAESYGTSAGFGTPTYSSITIPAGSNNQVLSWNSYGTPVARNINEVPAYTTSEDGKVLGVVDNQGTASLQWTTPAAGGVTDVEVNGSSVVSSGVASITIPAQVQSDWTESDTNDPAYIANKPTEKNLVAGANITITESGNNVTVATTVNGVPGVTSTDTGKYLKADYNGGSPTVSWDIVPTNTYTGGNMISISNNVVGVSTTAGITDIQIVSALPANPVSTVLYLIQET